MPDDYIRFLKLSDLEPARDVMVQADPGADLRVGLVSTVYGSGEATKAWCEHHFHLGAAHIVLVYDRLEDPEEKTAAGQISALYPPDRITIWSGMELMKNGWRGAADYPELKDLIHFAPTGPSSYGIPARQAMNASAALKAAKTNELGGAPLDWMLHLDQDELFYLEGSNRGGGSLNEHFSAAASVGTRLVRYVNHELLHPHQAGTTARFKVNPHLAEHWFGSPAWDELVKTLDMSPDSKRPYFNGYHNGKSAAAVQAGKCAAGVHSWWLMEEFAAAADCTLGGPSILHFRLASVAAFREKYLAMADTAHLSDRKLFSPPKVEKVALSLIQSLRGSGTELKMVHQGLNELHEQLTCFSDEETKILLEMGLIFTPELEYPLPVDTVSDSKEWR